MYKFVSVTLIIGAATTSSAIAQGFVGGELGIDVYAFSESDSIGAVNYSGGLEYAINRAISISGEIAVYDFDVFDASATSFALHAIYHINSTASVGVFSGREELEDDGVSFVGLEGGYQLGAISVEGYFADYDNDIGTSVFSLAGAYAFNDRISIIGDYGRAGQDSNNISRLSLGGEYTFDSGPNVYAEIGQVDAGDADSTFIGVGANIQFGSERGTTFGRRGFFASVIPGI